MKDFNLKTAISVILLVFAGICFMSAIISNQDSQKPIKVVLPPQGGLVGPIEVNKDRAVYQIHVRQNINLDFQNSYVTAELLDEQQEYLMAFGKEFYSESGYDSDGAWSESVSSYKMKVTIPKKGKYYLNFESEKTSGVHSNIQITIKRKRASALPLFVLGILVSLAVIIPKVLTSLDKVDWD